MPKNINTWRQLLKKHRKSFLRWLSATRRAEATLDNIASQLTEFIVHQIDNVRHEWPLAPIEFWNRIPEVRACCSNPATFTKPFAVEAYAYVHFLERYRRTWATLERLTQLAVLPFGTRGVRVLDVGTGPACSLYAIDDFYAALADFANESQIAEFELPEPQLACVEKSHSMVSFFHAFSEFACRRGPFGPLSNDFSSLYLPARRDWHRRQNEVETYWDEETQQYEEIYTPDWADAEAERLFRYRLIVLSNFLTLEADVERFRESLSLLFGDLKAGGVVLMLGGTGDAYQKIYERVAAIAHEVGLLEPTSEIDTTSRLRDDAAARIIKVAQHRVYQHISGLVGIEALQRQKAWPDYWTEKPSPRARPRFAFRVFRSGRWPTHRTAT